MTGAAGDGPHTAHTDPLTAVVAETFNHYRHADPTALVHQIVAAVRAHQNTTGQHTTAQALRDAADDIDTHPGACLSGYRVHDDEDSDADCSHCIAEDLRARADTLNTPADDAP